MKKDKTKEERIEGIDISYQNKDISSKFFAEEFRDTFFKVYGLDLPDIVSVEPTELPAVEVNDMSMDNLYYLADKSYAIVDYESKYSEENKVKYLGYVARLLKRVYNQDKIIPRIRIIIIYTADVRRGTTKADLDMGAEKLVLTEVFLSDINSDKIIGEIEKRINQNVMLSNEDKLRLMICSLAKKGKQNKINAIHRVIELAKEIDDVDVQRQIIAGLLAFSDKVISKEDVEEIRRIISMTKFDKLIYDEMMEAVNKATDEKTVSIAKNLLNDGISAEVVSRNTGLELSVVKELDKSIKCGKTEKNAVPV